MNYWIVKEGKQQGPMTLEKLMDTDLAPETLVWHPGLPTWAPAKSLPELASKYQDENDSASPDEPSPELDKPSPARPPVYTPYHTDPRPYVRATAPQRFADEIPPQPPTYFGWCIAALVLCCMIPAIVALIYSTKVSSRYVSGDYKGAQRASEITEMWLLVSVVCGLVSLPFYILMGMLG